MIQHDSITIYENLTSQLAHKIQNKYHEILEKEKRRLAKEQVAVESMKDIDNYREDIRKELDEIL